MVHVVAVADECEHPALQTAEVLAHRQQIGQCLERVLVVRQCVEHRNARLRRQFGHDGVVEGSDHDAVYPAIQVVGDIGDALTHSEADPLPQMQGVAAQLVQSCFKGHSRPQALLLENQGNVAPAQRL